MSNTTTQEDIIKRRILSAYYDGFNQAHYSHVHPEQFETKSCESAAAEYWEKNKQYILAALSSIPVSGGVWVKASERLPKKRHNYFVKMLSYRSDAQYIFNATCLFDGEAFVDDIDCNLIRHGNTVFEWLDESAVKDNWKEVDYNNPPKGEVLLLTKSKTILKGDWYENNLVKGFGWRTERSRWEKMPDGKNFLTLTPKEEVTHYHTLPALPTI